MTRWVVMLIVAGIAVLEPSPKVWDEIIVSAGFYATSPKLTGEILSNSDEQLWERFTDDVIILGEDKRGIITWVGRDCFLVTYPGGSAFVDRSGFRPLSPKARSWADGASNLPFSVGYEYGWWGKPEPTCEDLTEEQQAEFSQGYLAGRAYFQKRSED